MACGGNNAANQLAQQQQQQQNWTNQSIAGINKAFSGYTPAFFQGVGQAYQNWALPQLGQQYQSNRLALANKLADQGILNSSAAQQGQSALSQGLTQGQQQISNQALSQQQQLQQQVGQEKNQLYQQAQTANNPSQLTQQALSTVAGTQAPSTFAPLGNLFGQFGQQYLAGQNNSLYNNFANQYLNSFSNPAMYGQNLYSPSFSSLPSNLGY